MEQKHKIKIVDGIMFDWRSMAERERNVLAVVIKFSVTFSFYEIFLLFQRSA